MNDADGKGGDRRFMAMKGVRDLLAVLENGVSARRFAIDTD